MNSHAEVSHPVRDLRSIAAELKQELKEFAETRLAMLKAEFREKMSRWKVAAPLAGVGVVLLATSYLLVTASLVALVAVFIPGEFRWFFALLAIGVLWALLGGVAGYIAKREFELSRVLPQRTISVLQGDKAWLQKEARSQI
jgi:uncharacterized membrane protein YqjE